MEENDSDGEVGISDKSKDEQFEAVINHVRKYKFIYDFEYDDHKNRDKVNKAWNDIGKELGQTGKWVHLKWKYLREYYNGLKTGAKGESGQERGKKFSWPHYESLKFLDGVRYRNNYTASSMDLDQPRAKKRNSSSSADGESTGHNSEQYAEDLPSPTLSSSSIQSTRVETDATSTPKSSLLPIKKRSRNYNDEVNLKFLEYLEKQTTDVASKPDEPDEISCWSRLTESRLRQLHSSVARNTMMQCDRLIFESLSPIPSSSFHFRNNSGVYETSHGTYFGDIA